MGQVNITGTNTHQAPPSGSYGYGFNALGQAVKVNADGSTTLLEPTEAAAINILADLGVGLESELPESAAVGQIYIASDTRKKFVRADSISWTFTPLVVGTFVTNVINSELLAVTSSELLVLSRDVFEQLKLVGDATIKFTEDWQTVEIELPNGVVLQLGQEGIQLVYNGTGVLIPDGTPLYMTGAVTVGNITIVTVAPADASNIATAKVCGWSTTDIEIDSVGVLTWKGDLNGIDTSAYNIGDRLWLANGGGYTNEPPTKPNINVELGRILKVDAVNGSIHVSFATISPLSNTTSNASSQLFLGETTSDITGYKTLTKDVEPLETVKTIVVNNNKVLSDEYLSEPIGITVLKGGNAEMNMTVMVNSSVGVTRISAEFYLYKENGTEVFQFEAISADLNNTTPEPIKFSYSYADISMDATDRFLIKVYGETTRNQNTTITYYVGDGRGAFVVFPLPISHNELINLNVDENFQHVTTQQKELIDNSVQGAGATLNDDELIKVAADGKTASRTGIISDDGNIDIATGKNYKINGNQIATSNLLDGVDLVKGPVSAIDNTIPRFDGVTGKLIQAGSSITNLDNGNVGINNNNPTERLHVIGNVLATGHFNGLTIDKGTAGVYILNSALANNAINAALRQSDSGTVVLNAATGQVIISRIGNVVGSGTNLSTSGLRIGDESTAAEKLDVVGNAKVSGTVNGRVIEEDGAKLDSIGGYVTSNFAGKIAKTLDVNTLNAEVSLFTVPSGTMAKCGNMSDSTCKIFIFGTKASMSDDAVIEVTYNNFVGTARTRTFTLSTLNTDPYVFTCDLADQKIGPGEVKVKVTTAGTSTNGNVIITADAVW